VTDWWAVLSQFIIFRELDNLPVFWDLGAGRLEESAPVLRLAYALEALVTGSVLGVAGLLGKCCGVRVVGRERMPHLLWDEWERRESGGGKKRS
jgi:hypothetical protein